MDIATLLPCLPVELNSTATVLHFSLAATADIGLCLTTAFSEVFGSSFFASMQ
jgi:hypothetical protein